MSVDWVRQFCLSLPHTTEAIQWESHLVFKVGGKSYAITSLEPTHEGNWLSLKSSEERFPELIERIGIVPAPYLARAKWVSIETRESLPAEEVSALLREAYEIVFAKLPRKTRDKLIQPKQPAKRHAGKNRSRKKKPRR